MGAFQKWYYLVQQLHYVREHWFLRYIENVWAENKIFDPKYWTLFSKPNKFWITLKQRFALSASVLIYGQGGRQRFKGFLIPNIHYFCFAKYLH
jgi:hypothetical protein